MMHEKYTMYSTDKTIVHDVNNFKYSQNCHIIPIWNVQLSKIKKPVVIIVKLPAVTVVKLQLTNNNDPCGKSVTYFFNRQPLIPRYQHL